jgi:hypothetical protein
MLSALADTREFCGSGGRVKQNERAAAAGASSSSGEKEKTTATCFAPR